MPTPRKRNIIDVDFYGIVIAAAVCCACFFLVIKPLNAKHQAIVQDQEKCRQEIEDAQTRLASLQQVVNRQRRLSSSLASTRDILLDNTDMDDVIQTLAGLAEANGLILLEVDPQHEQLYEQYHTSSLAVLLKGLFPDFRAFLLDLGHQAPFIRIDEFNMTAEKTTESGQCKIVLNLIVFSPVQK